MVCINDFTETTQKSILDMTLKIDIKTATSHSGQWVKLVDRLPVFHEPEIV